MADNDRTFGRFLDGNDMRPKISVVVTTFNQSRFIEAAIESVLAQTYKPYEIIVVDDGSTDDTPERLAHFHENVRYIRQRNQGVAASRNTGVRSISGDLVAFLDGDDLWEPEKLAAQGAAYQQHPDSGIIVTDGVLFDEAGIQVQSLFHGIQSAFAGNWSSITVRCYGEFVQRNLIMTVSQTMIPADVLKDIGPSDTRFKVGSDYDLYFRIATRYPITFVRKSLMRCRYVPTSASGPAHLRFMNCRADDIRILRKQLREGPSQYYSEIAKLISRMVFDAAEAAYDYGRRENRSWALQYLLRLMMHNLTYPCVVFFLTGLSFPQPVARMLGRRARQFLKTVHGSQ